jgi:hypothetical protein
MNLGATAQRVVGIGLESDDPISDIRECIGEEP